ncbi:MAG TPA: septum formation initiator family protein [Ilumatobacteraceae bacterium]|nr:septum formation initiator family protein [Ilumatobacteraceae bacterium]
MSPNGTRNSSGHKTSSIPRPKDPTRPRARVNDTRRGEFTRPIPRDKQLVQGRGKRGTIAVFAVVVSAALVAALFVLPIKAYMRQQDDMDRKQAEVAALQQLNADLAEEVARLQTPAGIEEAAREEIGYVQRGEMRLTVLPEPDAPITMPDGWPYDTVAAIVSVRSSGTINP